MVNCNIVYSCPNYVSTLLSVHHCIVLTVCVWCSLAGREGPAQGNDKALATVTGIIDGTGSFGAGIGQVPKPQAKPRNIHIAKT